MRIAIAVVAVLCCVGLVLADPCRSGLQVSQRPGPYSALVSIGKERGTQHCYICEAADRPVVIVFARSLSEPLGKLVKAIDSSVAKHKDVDLRAWMTVLAEDQTAMDGKVVAWGKQHALRNLPVAVFEDTVGPPTYLLTNEADVTVLLSVKQKVAANFAFRSGELNAAAIQAIADAIPKIAKK